MPPRIDEHVDVVDADPGDDEDADEVDVREGLEAERERVAGVGHGHGRQDAEHAAGREAGRAGVDEEGDEHEREGGGGEVEVAEELGREVLLLELLVVDEQLQAARALLLPDPVRQPVVPLRQRPRAELARVVVLQAEQRPRVLGCRRRRAEAAVDEAGEQLRLVAGKEEPGGREPEADVRVDECRAFLLQRCREQARQAERGAAGLGFGCMIASEIEAPNMLVNTVYEVDERWVQGDSATEP